MALQIDTVQPPFTNHEVGGAAALLLARAEVLGMVPEQLAAHRLDTRLMRGVLRELRARGLAARVAVAATPQGWLDAMAIANAALEGSPVPALEWPALRGILGDALLARLCGISEMSLRRYSAGQRRTPDDVAQRLHTLLLVVADLRGAYNEYGVRRWFERPRVSLGGKSPLAALPAGWDPDDASAVQVRALAASLTASPAA
ncbi:MAG: hypothetical protein ACYDAC_10600 [Candidatus Dormibacteria bacterium]